MVDRKLQKCPVCKEWFNTTGEIMLRHILNHTEVQGKMRAFLSAHAKVMDFSAKAIAAPFPENVIYHNHAIMALVQAERIKSQREA